MARGNKKERNCVENSISLFFIKIYLFFLAPLSSPSLANNFNRLTRWLKKAFESVLEDGSCQSRISTFDLLFVGTNKRKEMTRNGKKQKEWHYYFFSGGAKDLTQDRIKSATQSKGIGTGRIFFWRRAATKQAPPISKWRAHELSAMDAILQPVWNPTFDWSVDMHRCSRDSSPSYLSNKLNYKRFGILSFLLKSN